MQKAIRRLAAVVLAALVCAAIFTVLSVEARGGSQAGTPIVLPLPTPAPHP